MSSIDKLTKELGIKKFITESNFNYGLVVFAFILGIYLNWSIQNILLFCALIYCLLFPQTSQFFAKIALFCLILTPILLIINRSSKAEDIATIAYFALVVTAVTAIIEYRKMEKGKSGK